MSNPRQMRTPAAWVGKRINPAKWVIPTGYAVSATTGKLQAVKRPIAPLPASRRVDRNMPRAACLETYSSALPVNLFGGYQPDRTPTIADRRAYGFDASIVVFHVEQATGTKANFTRQACGVVFTVGMMDNRHAGAWFAAHAAAVVRVEPVRYRVGVGSVRIRVPFTPESCVAQCLTAAFYAGNPDYRVLEGLPVSRSVSAEVPTCKTQRSPSARRCNFNTRFYAQRARVEVTA